MTSTHSLNIFREELISKGIKVPANAFITEVSIESTGTTFASWILNGIVYTGKATMVDHPYRNAYIDEIWSDSKRRNGDM